MTNVQISKVLLTVIIPTKNRSAFLRRLLIYYAATGFDYKIIIADSSEKSHLDHNIETINTVNSKLDISHELYEDTIVFKEKIFQSLSRINTPYVVIGADDDFFVPNTIELAINFLENNSDYSLISGEPLIFYLDSSKSHGRIQFLGGYPQNSIEDDDPCSRLIKHLSNVTSTWYSIYRTQHLMEYWKIMRLSNFDTIFIELVPSCLSMIQGKFKKLDNLYMVRQYNAPREYSLIDSKIEWASDPSFESQFILFREKLCEYLLMKCNMDMNTAKKEVNKAFLLFILPTLYGEYKQEMKKLRTIKKDRIATIFSPITIQDIITILQTLKVHSGLDWLINKYRIYKLCRRSSRFYHDLKPIIESIENERSV
nr:TIGR00180 family glycosyltransferase [uncultured Methanoregula sp.]